MGNSNFEQANRVALGSAKRRGAIVRMVSGLVCLGLPLLALARPSIPPAPPPPPPAGTLEGGAEGARGNPRNLSPEQRDAIRRLSQEEREALANRAAREQGRPGGMGPRLSPEERRHLRQQIREEHERRGGGRFGSGKRP